MHAPHGERRFSRAQYVLHELWDALRFAGRGLKYGSLESVNYQGRQHWVMGEDVANGRILCRIVAERRRARAELRLPVRLVTLRGEFRRIARRRQVGGLLLCLDHVDPETNRLGIWLLGRTRTTAGIGELARFIDHHNVRIRREAARALRRLGGWAELRQMARDDWDPRVVRLASLSPQQPLEERLERLARSIHSGAQTSSKPRPAELFVQFAVGPGKEPKAASLIRMILERIRYAVRGH